MSPILELQDKVTMVMVDINEFPEVYDLSCTMISYYELISSQF